MDLKKQAGLKRCGSLKTTNMRKQSCENIGKVSQSMETSEKSTSKNSRKLMCLRGDFRARISLSREKEKGFIRKEVVYGKNMPVPLAKYDRDTHSLKMWQTSLTKGCQLSLQTLPKWGMMQNGLVYALPTSGHCTSGKGYSLLPTPTASEATTANILTENIKKTVFKTKSGTLRRMVKGGSWSLGLARTLHFSLPTVSANEYKGSGRSRFRGSKDFRGAKMSEGLRTCETDKIYLNPCFAEVVMGFPSGWTELSASEMRLFRSARNLLEK